MIQLKVDLRDDHQEHFEQLKEHWKFGSNTDTVRFMINYNWEQEIGKKSKYVELQDKLINKIKRMLERKDIQQIHYLYSTSDFVNAAIRKFLDDIKGTRRSIFDWDIRNTLSEDELIISKAIAKVQDGRSGGDFTFDLLIDELGWRNKEKLTDILNGFQSNNYISSMQIGDELVYHAFSP